MKYIGDILYDELLLDKNRKWVIFGAGMYGLKILRFLDLNGVKKNIICFCDSNVKLDKHVIEGVPIYYTPYVIKKYPYAEYLISGRYHREMYEILKKENIHGSHILFM